MARRPAYNTKAEKARRAEARERLLAEVSGAGEAADELMPFLSAWVQLQRRQREYEMLFGRSYSYHESRAEPALQLTLAREHAQMANSMLYVSERATQVSLAWNDRAMQASINAWYLLKSEVPYSAEQIASISALYDGVTHPA